MSLYPLYSKADKLMVYKLVLVCLALGPRCCRLGGLLDFCSVVLCQECVKSLSGHIRERERGIPGKGDAGSPQVWQALPALESAQSTSRLLQSAIISSLCVESHKEFLLLHVPSSGSHKRHPNSLPAGEKCCLCQLKTSSYAFLSSLSVYRGFFLQNSSARGNSCWFGFFFLPSYFLFFCNVTAGWCWLTGFCTSVVLFTRMLLIYCTRAGKIWETIICLQSRRAKSFLARKISLGPLQL